MITYHDDPFVNLPLTERQRGDSLLLACSNDGYPKAICISSLYSDIYLYFLKYKNIKSMAYEDKDLYCLKNHDHDCYTSCDYVNKTVAESYTNIMNINDDIVKCLVHIPETSVITREKRKYMNKLGEVQFILQKTTNTNIRSTGFNGWVPADGSEYNVLDFVLSSELRTIYQKPGDSSKFVVPLLTSFFRFVGPTATSGMQFTFQENPGHNSTAVHNHNITYNVSSTNPFNLTVTPPSGLSAIKIIKVMLGDKKNKIFPSKNSKCIHEGGNPNKWFANPSLYSTEQDVSNITWSGLALQNGGLDFNSADKLNTESYPPHNIVPMYVYIGPSVWSE